MILETFPFIFELLASDNLKHFFFFSFLIISNWSKTPKNTQTHFHETGKSSSTKFVIMNLGHMVASKNKEKAKTRKYPSKRFVHALPHAHHQCATFMRSSFERKIFRYKRSRAMNLRDSIQSPNNGAIKMFSTPASSLALEAEGHRSNCATSSQAHGLFSVGFCAWAEKTRTDGTTWKCKKNKLDLDEFNELSGGNREAFRKHLFSFVLLDCDTLLLCSRR